MDKESLTKKRDEKSEQFDNLKAEMHRVQGEFRLLNELIEQFKEDGDGTEVNS